MSASILQTRDLRIGYRNRRRADKVIAADLNLNLDSGRLVCLLGPNGAGKSTLMRTLAGMQAKLGGKVLLEGSEVSTLQPEMLAKKLSIVLTERVNAGLLSAYALVALGRYPYTDWRGRLTEADETIVQRALVAVGAEGLAASPVSELSDGERQKVMIARALAQETPLMMLDEPTAYLDLPHRVEIMQILRRLAHDRGRAVLLSTHDLDLALRSADEIWLMTNGRLFSGAPEDLVLSGAFAEAFASQGVSFDTLSGAFRMEQAHKGKVDVVGEGVDAVWTVRALERVGYQVHLGRNGSPLWVTCQENCWYLATEDGRSEYHSLADLAAALKQKEKQDE
jgi:iron complex transport system ATP-binding protein